MTETKTNNIEIKSNFDGDTTSYLVYVDGEHHTSHWSYDEAKAEADRLTAKEDITMTETTTTTTYIKRDASTYELLEAMTTIIEKRVGAYRSDFANDCYILGHADGIDGDTSKHFAWFVRECGTWLVNGNDADFGERVADYRERYAIRAEYAISEIDGLWSLALLEDTFPEEVPEEPTPTTRALFTVCGRSLVEVRRVDGSLAKYVICHNYDPSKPYGEQWTSGQYFDVWSESEAEVMLIKALRNFEGLPSTMSGARAVELATKFADKLADISDPDDIAEFFTDECELDEDEAEFLGIELPKTYDTYTIEVTRTLTYRKTVAIPHGMDEDEAEEYLNDNYDFDTYDACDDDYEFSTTLDFESLSEDEAENEADFVMS